MRNWHGQKSPSGRWHTGKGGSSTSADFNVWFLASGTWDNDGRWYDFVEWDPSWFLASGAIKLFGSWDDAEIWYPAFSNEFTEEFA